MTVASNYIIRKLVMRWSASSSRRVLVVRLRCALTFKHTLACRPVPRTRCVHVLTAVCVSCARTGHCWQCRPLPEPLSNCRPLMPLPTLVELEVVAGRVSARATLHTSAAYYSWACGRARVSPCLLPAA